MECYLPEFKGLRRGISSGRNPYEGYQRGWGLQFGNVRGKILQDPLYQEGLRLAKGRTIVAELNRMNIFLILKYFLPKIAPGHIVEFGAYLGGNAIFMAYVAGKILPGTKVYALDTFEGMPPSDENVDAHSEGDFGDVDIRELRQYVEKIGLDNLELCKGYFQETTETVLKEAGRILLAHIDCDIRSSVEYAYEATKSYMVNGGYLVFDDATTSSCLGATQVVEDLVIRRDGMNGEQIFPHFVFRSWRKE